MGHLFFDGGSDVPLAECSAHCGRVQIGAVLQAVGEQTQRAVDHGWVTIAQQLAECGGTLAGAALLQG